MDNFVHLSARQGGTAPGVNHFPTGGMKALWIATFTMFIIWLVGLLLAPIAARFLSGREGGEAGMSRNFNNLARAARDAFLILLVTTLVTQAGYGASPGVVALHWVSFGFLILWLLVNTFAPNLWWLEFLAFLPVAVLQVINFALAFRGAPSYR
ncbi:hypothetical protein HK097_001110 [Rhizophlyctis rosea]|uniref:Uncharacterized protein n=1 Tax=Rhizophlyctis rosea TaxID=64517 RepID=A0AAD5S4T0_9FUNG|nr:hypothetical protein HK097_001110 [Rhizophlyctis rosea]